MKQNQSVENSQDNNVRQTTFLPSDVNGRIACFLAGVFFATVGIQSLFALLRFGKLPMAGVTVIEILVLISLFGVGLIVWALFTPPWLVRSVDFLVAHLLVFILVLFIPFAIEFILLVLAGAV